jgi:putative transposase
MGRDRYRFGDHAAPHFVTKTVLQWLPLFAQPAHVEMLFGALRYHQRQSGLVLYGYVVMENHCHLLARAPDLPKVLASVKSYTAKQIVNRLTERHSPVLDLLAMHKARHKADRAHQVWQEGSHPEIIEGEAMMRVKLDYIHNNPVKRGYVDKATHWRYSSARDYEGCPGLLRVETRW